VELDLEVLELLDEVDLIPVLDLKPDDELLEELDLKPELELLDELDELLKPEEELELLEELDEELLKPELELLEELELLLELELELLDELDLKAKVPAASLSSRSKASEPVANSSMSSKVAGWFCTCSSKSCESRMLFDSS